MFCYSLFPTVLYWQPLVSVFFKKLFGCTIKQETFLSFSASRYSYIDGVCWIFQPKMPFLSTMCVLLAWSLIIIFYFITSIVKTLKHWICVSSLYATLHHIKKWMQTLFLLLFLPLQLFHHCWSNIACQGFCSLTHEIFIGNSETLMFYHVIISFILSTLKMRIILSYFSYLDILSFLNDSIAEMDMTHTTTLVLADWNATKFAF